MSKQSRILLIVCAVVTALCVLLLCVHTFTNRSGGTAESEETVVPLPDAASRYAESAEYRAAREWQDFTAEYDPDGSILQSSVAEGGMDYAGDYTMYRVYSQELADKLEDIASRTFRTVSYQRR